MARLNYTVLLSGIILRLVFEGSLSGAQSQGTSAHVVSTISTLAPPALAAGPAGTLHGTSQKETVTYLRDVLPIFMGKCVRCHNTESTIMYNWLDYETAYRDRWEIRKRVWDSWRGSYYKQPMPAGNGVELQAMTEEERMTIKRWVEAGAPYGVQSADVGTKSKEERIALGRPLFATICAACHQPTGKGIPGQFPPLAGSDFLNADKHRAIKVVVRGLQGELVVNKRTFNNTMPPMPLSDDNIANALTYVYNSFGNSGQEVTPQEVRSIRDAKGVVADIGMKGRANTARQPSPWE
jgi:mono/diheme cytochrome c family protein